MHKFGVSTPHTSHCAPTGEIMISTLGKPNGDAQGDFLCIDSETLEPKGTWTKGGKRAKFGYDFWYQPYHDTLVSSEWGVPEIFKQGFSADSVAAGTEIDLNHSIIAFPSYHSLSCLSANYEGLYASKCSFTILSIITQNLDTPRNLMRKND